MKFSAFMIRHVVTVACILMFTCLGTMPSHADKRVALIIGNGAYAHAPHLLNPIHDAEDVAAALKRMGFETIVGTDLNQTGMQDIAIRFARAARTADVAMFYYSGHAMQYGGVNYLVPIDVQLHDEADLRRMARVDEILADLQQAKNLRILVLDSCRDNPLAEQLKGSIGSTRGINIGRGLARMESPDGTIISYATQVGRTAEDGKGRNSPYTSAFLKYIADKDEISTIFHRISSDVYDASNRTQIPELSLSFFGEFYLNGKMQITVPPTPSRVDSCAAAESHWKAADAIGSVTAFEDHLARFPNCAFTVLAKAKIENLKSQVAAEAQSVPPTAPLIDSNDREAARLYKLAADRGDAEAQLNLGFFYEKGRGGVPKDEREAARLYKLAAGQGLAFAQNLLGLYYTQGRGGLPKDYEEAARLYKLAVDQGFSAAQRNLGWLYQNGFGVQKDDREAVRLYKLAVERGSSWAEDDLGWLYQNGRGGLPKDEREAARLYKLSAEQGHPWGQQHLGWFYQYGLGGLPKDDREAARLYKLAADQGLAVAQNNLGWFYQHGFGGLPKDNREAARFYKLAADQGISDAQRNLANLYRDSRVGTRNPRAE